jgi:nitroreductase
VSEWNGKSENPQPLAVSLRAGEDFSAFKPQGIPDISLEHMIELARLTPSEWNLQPWRWIIVRSESGKQRLESSVYIHVRLSSAPAVFICLSDTQAWKSAPQYLQEMVANKKMTEEEARETLRRIREYYSVSPEIAKRAALANAFVALHQLLLAAAESDLSAYWVTEFNERKVKTDFHIPDQFVVAALLALGYQNGALPSPTPKLPLQALVYEEKFGEAFQQK